MEPHLLIIYNNNQISTFYFNIILLTSIIFNLYSINCLIPYVNS